MYRVRVSFTGMQGSPWLATHYFAEQGGTAQEAQNAVAAFWGAVDALMDSEVNWVVESDVTLIDEVTGDLTGVTTVTPGSGAGGAVGDALPLASQALVRWRTGIIVNGREVRGRTFIPALVEASNDNGELLAASRTTIQTAATALINDVPSTLVIYSRENNLFRNVASANVSIPFAYLGSRRD